MSTKTNIYNLRKQAGLSQKQLAEILGVSDKTVSSWETGEKEPRMGVIQKMADYFGVTKGYIINDDPSTDGGVVRLDADEMDFLREIRTRPEMKIMFSAAKNATKEDLIKAVKIVEALRDAEEGKGK